MKRGDADGCELMMLSPPLFLLKYPFSYGPKLTKQQYQTFTMVSVFQHISLHGHPHDRQYLNFFTGWQKCSVRYVQNVNARGTIYSMWIILRKCEGGCEARLVRSREQIW